MAKKPMSDEHKQALAEGRQSARDVKAYLEGLKATAPKKGRKRTQERVVELLEEAKATIEDDNAGVLDVLNARQAQADLEKELDAMKATTGPDMKALEAAFVKSAKRYSEAKAISYGTWRKMGVAADVLAKAGIKRGNT